MHQGRPRCCVQVVTCVRACAGTYHALDLPSSYRLICPPPLNCSFYDKDAPIYTMSRFLPPSKVMGAGEAGPLAAGRL